MARPSRSDIIHLLAVTGDTAYAKEVEDQFSTVGSFEVTTVGTVNDALECLESRGDIQCIISDHDLPDVDGITLLQAVRAQHPDLPFILFTSEGSEEVASRAINARVTDYLIKEQYGNEWDRLAQLIEKSVDYYRIHDDSADRSVRAKAIMEASPVPMAILQEEVFVYVNEAWIGLVGADSREDFAGIAPLDVFGSDTRELTVEQLAGIQSGHRNVDLLETEIVDADGATIPVEATASRIIWNGEPAVAAILHDISDRRAVKRERDRIEDDMGVQRRFIEEVFEDSPIAKTVLDTEGNIIRANRRAEEVFGLSEAEITDRQYDAPEWRIVDEAGDSIPREALPFDRVLGTGEPIYGYELGVERADGELVWLSVNIGPIHDDGEIQYLVAAMEDVTERKRLEGELRESEELHRLVLSNITDTVVITDDEGRFTYVCPNVHHLFGYSADAVREMGTLDELIGDGLLANDVTTAENIEHEILDAAGDLHSVLVTVRPVSIDGGTRLYTIRDITDYRRQEERFQAFVEHSSDVVTVIDESGGIEYVSPSVERVLGYDPDTLTGTNAFETVHPADRDQVIQTFTEALEQPTGTRVSAEYRAEHRDGSWRWVESIATVRETPAGGFVINTHDISDYKAVQAELEERATHLQQAQTLADLGSWHMDIQANELEWSDEIYEIFGFDPSMGELSYEAFLELVHQDDRDRVNEHWQAALEGDPYDIQHRILADGEVKWVHERAEIEFDQAGEPIRGIGVAQNITDQKERERELQELQESRSLALKAANAGIWDWNLETDEVVWDESLEQLFGFDPGTFEGTYDAFASRVHPNDLPATERAIERALEYSGQFESEFRIQHPTGVERWVYAEGKVVTDDRGDPVRMLGVNIDITDRKEREQHMRVIDRVLRHNLRNDLNFIGGSAATISEMTSGQAAKLADRIVDQADKLLNTTEKEREIVEILTSTPSMTTVDLVEMLERTVESVHETHPEANIELSRPDQLSLTVTDRFETALHELTDNAILHNDTSDPEVSIDFEEMPDTVRIRIADNGPPIPDMNIGVLLGDHDIEPLYHGSGLGLWLVHWIVRRSNGTLEFAENEPRGNVVTIHMPRTNTAGAK